jgi:hypothetical protein
MDTPPNRKWHRGQIIAIDRHFATIRLESPRQEMMVARDLLPADLPQTVGTRCEVQMDEAHRVLAVRRPAE